MDVFESDNFYMLGRSGRPAIVGDNQFANVVSGAASGQAGASLDIVRSGFDPSISPPHTITPFTPTGNTSGAAVTTPDTTGLSSDPNATAVVTNVLPDAGGVSTGVKIAAIAIPVILLIVIGVVRMNKS